MLLVNSYNTIVRHQGLLWNDDIHPQPVGGWLYAKIVREPAHQTSFLPHAKYATLY